MDSWRIDSHKLAFHPAWVAQWLEADTWEKAKKVVPIYWEITTSAACNHRCTFCSTDAIGYPAILMDADILGKRLEEAGKLGVKSVMFGGTGEPLVHKKISEIVIRARLSNLDVAFTTNGILLDKLEPVSACTWIKVSLNSGTKENYAAIHRTKPEDWNKVWTNIREAVKRKGNCTIGVQCVVLPDNKHTLWNLAQMCLDAGVDYLVLKPYSQATFMLGTKYKGTTYDKWHQELQTLTDDYFRKGLNIIYRRDSMRQESEPHHYDRCRATPNVWVYNMADGRVFTCSAHLLDERFCIGNLNDQSFQEIWEGEARRRNWEMMREFDIKQCRLNCRFDKSNRYLAEFSTIQHVNFP